MAKGRVKVHLLLSKVKLRGLKVFTMCVVWLDLKCEGDIKSGDSYLVMEAIEFNKRVRDPVTNEAVAVTYDGPNDAPASCQESR